MDFRRLATAFVLIAGCFCTVTLAYAQGGQSNAEAKPNGEEVFKRACAACHVSQPAKPYVLTPEGPPPEALMARAVPPERLKMFTPGAILNALTNGKMQAQAASLSVAERRAVSEYASGQTFSGLEAALKNSQCKSPPPKAASPDDPQWNGWGNGIASMRYQPKEQGKLTAADLPRLKLKWAFGYADVSAARAQPTVVGGKLYAASENATVYALDAKTGCTYWTFKADAGVRAAVSVGRHTVGGQSHPAVFFGDSRATAYAVDAETGKLLWKRKVDDHRAAGITGAPVVYGGRMFIPVQGIGEEGQGIRNGYACCTFRGNVTALDTNTGEVLWKTYTVSENKPIAKSKEGVQLYGPAGGGIWAAPTVDAKRGVLYVGTGNSYMGPLQKMTNAVMAMDLQTGAIKWSQQFEPGDIWTMGCKAKNPDDPACPEVLGPDYDFSSAPTIVSSNGRDLILIPQKSGVARALDPDKSGKVVWEYRFGKGSGLGGQWGAATDGQIAYVGVGDMLTPTPGGMTAVTLADGKQLWKAPPQKKLCGEVQGCSAAQGGALTAIPGAVLNSGMDGGIRAYSSKDGAVLWQVDTNREFDTVNGIKARGGSMDGAGPVVVNGMVYVNSGYGGLVGMPGNVLLAFGLD